MKSFLLALFLGLIFACSSLFAQSAQSYYTHYQNPKIVFSGQIEVKYLPLKTLLKDNNVKFWPENGQSASNIIFPPQKEGTSEEIEIFVFDFGPAARRDSILSILTNMNMRPANAWELLAIPLRQNNLFGSIAIFSLDSSETTQLWRAVEPLCIKCKKEEFSFAASIWAVGQYDVPNCVAAVKVK